MADLMLDYFTDYLLIGYTEYLHWKDVKSLSMLSKKKKNVGSKVVQVERNTSRGVCVSTNTVEDKHQANWANQ